MDWQCDAPGKYQCDCGAKFYALADGSTSTTKSEASTTRGSDTTRPDIEQTIPPRRHEDFDASADVTMPGKRNRKPDGRFEPGDMILARYKVLAKLGQGGMGVVYKCFDEIAGIEVALKALPPDLCNSEYEMEEVKDNFHIVHKLHHPNIANYNNLERDNSNGNYYLIMECVEGEDLRRWIRRSRQLGDVSFDSVFNIVSQIADALDYAHKQNVIHRDIKPGNIMIVPDGTIKILDFGLAAQIHTSMTRVSMAYCDTSGTGPYMAPEQWKGQAQGASADQYALAVMTYEMLAGHLPFDNPDISILREAVLHGTPQPIDNVPINVQAAIRQAMNQSPGDRFNSCSDFVKALKTDTFSPSKKNRLAVAYIIPLVVFGLVIAAVLVAAVVSNQRRVAREQVEREHRLAEDRRIEKEQQEREIERLKTEKLANEEKCHQAEDEKRAVEERLQELERSAAADAKRNQEERRVAEARRIASQKNYTHGVTEFSLQGNEVSWLPEEYVPPYIIRAKCKTDRYNIRFLFLNGLVIFNWECDDHDLRLDIPTLQSPHHLLGHGYVGVDTWADIMIKVTQTEIMVYVDGECRYRGHGKFQGIKSRIGIKTEYGCSSYKNTVNVKDFSIERGESEGNPVSGNPVAKLATSLPVDLKNGLIYSNDFLSARQRIHLGVPSNGITYMFTVADYSSAPNNVFELHGSDGKQLTLQRRYRRNLEIETIWGSEGFSCDYVEDGSPHTILVVASSENIRVYVDNMSLGSKRGQHFYNSMIIERIQANIDVSKVLIWRRRLSDDEIQAAFNHRGALLGNGKNEESDRGADTSGGGDRQGPLVNAKVVIRGNIDGKGVFRFYGNAVTYIHESWKYPENVTINGRQWQNLKRPFILDRRYVFSHSKIVRQSGRGRISGISNNSGFNLTLDDSSEGGSAFYSAEIQCGFAVERNTTGVSLREDSIKPKSVAKSATYNHDLLCFWASLENMPKSMNSKGDVRFTSKNDVKCAYFDGKSALWTDKNPIVGNSPCTISIWVFYSGDNSSMTRIPISLGREQPQELRSLAYFYGYGHVGELVLDCRFGSVDSKLFKEKRWICLTAVIDTNTNQGRLYRNGKLLVESHIPRLKTYNNVTLGGYCSKDGTQIPCWQGYLANARIYTKAFSDSEVRALYESEKAKMNP